MSLVHEPDVLPQVAVPLPTHGAGSPLLLVHVGQVPLQVGLQVTAVATLCALVVLHLKGGSLFRNSSDLLGLHLSVLLVDVML